MHLSLHLQNAELPVNSNNANEVSVNISQV